MSDTAKRQCLFAVSDTRERQNAQKSTPGGHFVRFYRLNLIIQAMIER